ncbi:hypothetical protein [Micromonospora sp. NPDC006431]|uniref:hypothetical protein n=1 Tax=Micromonospora sp. NPDC006431 TaxID=3364235 RepID=UPI0036BF9E75
MRPLWLCRICAAPWPCQPARLLLLMEHRRDRVALSVYLAGLLFDATADLMKLNPNATPSPAELFDRFLAWAAPESRNRRQVDHEVSAILGDQTPRQYHDQR